MSKAIVVTGGTKGIGRAIVCLFADKGFDIITCSRSRADLEGLKAELEARHAEVSFEYLEADLADRQQVQAFVEFAMTHAARIQVLVNNTGVFIPGQIQNEEEGVFEQMLNTNLNSAYHVTRGLLPALINNKGHIFNMCSTASIMPYVNGGSYCISKFALLGMTKVLREELKEKGVRVTAIMPGATMTASWAGTELPEDRFMPAADVAHAVWAAYALSPRTVVEEIVMRPQLGDL